MIRTYPLQQIRKTQRKQPQHPSRAINPHHLQRNRPGRAALGRASLPGVPGVYGSRVRRRAGGARGRRRRRGVGRCWMLCAAGMVGAAVARARVVGPAGRDALVAVLDAHEVGKRQGVL